MRFRKSCNLPFRFRYNFDRLLIYGMSGSGKTFVVKQILECLREKGYRYKVLNGNTVDYHKNDIFEMVDFDIDKTLKEFTAYGVKNAPITLVFEDLTAIFYNNSIPKILQAAILTGRRIGIGFVFITHRLRRIPSIIPSNSNKVIIFRPTDVRDLQILAIPDLNKNIGKLKKHEFLYYSYEDGQYFIGKL